MTAPLLAGCSNLGPVSWGEEAGGGGAAMANGAAAASGETVRTGSISTPLIAGTVTVIAEHQATARQAQLTTERATAWLTRNHVPATRLTHRHHPRQARRYIAVDTSGDGRSSPQARRSVMIFDTEAQRVVGNSVYDVQTPPDLGTIARFDTYAAQYIGTGQ